MINDLVIRHGHDCRWKLVDDTTESEVFANEEQGDIQNGKLVHREWYEAESPKVRGIDHTKEGTTINLPSQLLQLGFRNKPSSKSCSKTQLSQSRFKRNNQTKTQTPRHFTP